MTQRPALRLWLFIAVVGAFVADAATAEAGGGRRARLSRDLADRVSARRADTTNVILTGTETDLQAIALRHGARIKKVLRGAAVLELSAGQLEALSQDPEIDHLSGDVPVSRTDDGHRPVDRRRSGVAQPTSRSHAATTARVSASPSSTPASPSTGRCAAGSSRASTSRWSGGLAIPTATARTSPASLPAVTTPATPAWRRAPTSSACGCSRPMDRAKPAT